MSICSRCRGGFILNGKRLLPLQTKIAAGSKSPQSPWFGKSNADAQENAFGVSHSPLPCSQVDFKIVGLKPAEDNNFILTNCQVKSPPLTGEGKKKVSGEEALEILIRTQRSLIEMHLSWQIEPNVGGWMRGWAAAAVGMIRRSYKLLAASFVFLMESKRSAGERF